MYTCIKHEYNKSLKYLTLKIEKESKHYTFLIPGFDMSIVGTHTLDIGMLDFLSKYSLSVFLFYTLLPSHLCGSVWWSAFQLDWINKHLGN